MTFPDLDSNLATLAIAVFAAGLARGFAGFGNGMIIAPAAAALYGPKAALVIILVLDSLPVIPVTIPAFKLASWRELLPILLGACLLLPVGIWVLKNGDVEILRWAISAIILACLATLWAGWRYRGRRSFSIAAAVGAASGFLNGLAAIPGPPVIVYWVASAATAAVVRANLLVFLFLSIFISGANIWAAGLLTVEAVVTGAMVAPVYFVAIGIGWLLFGKASEQTYRTITFVLILISATLALPVLDGLLRS